MSKAKKIIKDIIEPIDYQMSKLPTFKNKSDATEGTQTTIHTSNSNPSTETASVFFYRENNQRQADKAIVVSG